LQVFSRYVINSSFPWTEELARLAWISLGMVGLPVALKRNIHVKIDVITSRLKGKVKTFHFLLMYGLIGFGSLIFCTQGYRLFMSIVGSKGTSMRWFPMEIVYITLPVGGGVTILVCVVEILTRCFPRSGSPDPGKG
jgi:TRAP-type C4-dicarboxylate transport system permease small subunit